MRKFIILFLVLCITDYPLIYACEKPAITKDLDSRALQLVKYLIDNSQKISPSTQPYSDSGIKDLVYLGGAVLDKITSSQKKYGDNLNVNLVDISRDIHFNRNEKVECVFDRQLGKEVFFGVTHVIVISYKNNELFGLRLRYDKDRNKFHIIGYWTLTGTI